VVKPGLKKLKEEEQFFMKKLHSVHTCTAVMPASSACIPHPYPTTDKIIVL